MAGPSPTSNSNVRGLLTSRDQNGWRGLLNNPKCLALAVFASLGGVLYGYNQGVFSQVQVMADFDHRFHKTVSIQTLSPSQY